MLWHNDSPPNGWLVCNGQEVPIADYTTLYNLITVDGSVKPYGENTDGLGGAGSTHFRLPNLTDKFIVAPPNSSLIGSTAGADNHSHNFNASLPAVNSSVQSHSHTYSPGNFAAADSAPGHTHSVSVSFSANVSNAETNVKRAATGNTGAAFQIHGHSASATTNAANSNHSHAITGGTGFTNVDGHSHVVSVNFGTYSASGTSIPAHQRVYFIVFASASEVGI